MLVYLLVSLSVFILFFHTISDDIVSVGNPFSPISRKKMERVTEIWNEIGILWVDR